MATFDHRVLRRWRLESGLRPEQVCVLAQLSYPYLRAIEDGARPNPSVHLLGRLAAVYGRRSVSYSPTTSRQVPGDRAPHPSRSIRSAASDRPRRLPGPGGQPSASGSARMSPPGRR